MKLVLKLLAIPAVMILGLFCVLGNLASNLSSYVIGPLMLFILGCGIYCFTQARWMDVAILLGMEMACFLLLSCAVAMVMQAEDLRDTLRDFLHS